MRSKLAAGGLAVAIGFLLVTNPVVADAAKQITGKQIKNNSVTTKDIKNNNVTTKDIKNNNLTGQDIKDGSLAATDFAPNELPFTRAFKVTAPGPIAVGTGARVTVATLNLTQPGTYVVTAKVYLNNDAAADSFVNCNLSDGVVTDVTSVGLNADATEDDHRTIGGLMASTIAAPTAVTFACQRFAGGAVSANDVSIVAIKVNSLN